MGIIVILIVVLATQDWRTEVHINGWYYYMLFYFCFISEEIKALRSKIKALNKGGTTKK